jgi:GNAT superfamily N-acetyltransferase
MLSSPLAAAVGGVDQPAGAAAAAASSPSPASPSDLPATSPPSLSDSSAFRVLELSDPETRTIPAANEPFLRAAERVHRQLRVALPEGTEGYVSRIKRVVQDGGRILVAVEKPLSDSATPVVLGVCVHRFYYDLARGGVLRNFIDDLVTDSEKRSHGVGAAMLEGARAQARALGVANIELDSGVQRARAHAFYFRSGMTIPEVSFGGCKLDPLPSLVAGAN